MKKIWYSSRFYIIFYAMVLILAIGLSTLGFAIPVTALADAWPFIIAVYCGFDRFVDYKNTKSLNAGQMSMGDLAKLRFIIFESFVVMCFAVYCSVITGIDFNTEFLVYAFVASILAYVGGNKLVKSARFTGPDKNNNGIPDELEEEFEKWMRQERKNGVDEKFITFDYFLDSREVK